MSTEPAASSWAELATPDRPTVDASSRELPSCIDGVEVRRPATHADHRGALTPVVDVRDAFWAEPIVYAYRFTVLPGRIKGWAMHEQQTDRYIHVTGSVRVVLLDGRQASPTHQTIEKIHLRDRAPGLVLLPAGIWHATQNWGTTEAHVVNLPTRPYDPDHPDKLRIDPHSGAIAFDWSLRDG